MSCSEWILNNNFVVRQLFTAHVVCRDPPYKLHFLKIPKIKNGRYFDRLFSCDIVLEVNALVCVW